MERFPNAGSLPAPLSALECLFDFTNGDATQPQPLNGVLASLVLLINTQAHALFNFCCIQVRIGKNSGRFPEKTGRIGPF